MVVASLTEGLNPIEKGFQIVENIDSNEVHVTATKQGMKKIIGLL